MRQVVTVQVVSVVPEIHAERCNALVLEYDNLPYMPYRSTIFSTPDVDMEPATFAAPAMGFLQWAKRGLGRKHRPGAQPRFPGLQATQPPWLETGAYYTGWSAG